MEVAEKEVTAVKDVVAENEAGPGNRAPERRQERERRPVRSIEIIVRKPHWEDFWRGMGSVVVVFEAWFFGLVVILAVVVYWFR